METDDSEVRKVLTTGLDSFHVYWMNHPWKMAGFGIAYAAALTIFSLILGIASIFKVGESTYNGYMKTHWGWQTFIFMPVAALAIGYLFRLLEKGVSSVDAIILPNTAPESFADWLGSQLGRHWRLWIAPLSLFLIVAITFSFDYPGIFGPLIEVPSWAQRGWGTDGYRTEHAPPVSYFLFNLAVFATQIAYGYCGFMTLFLVSFLIRIIVSEGLSRGEGGGGALYRVKWNYEDAKGRCGLHEMDKVFVFYVVVVLAAIGFCTISVLGAKWEGHVDAGSAMLAVGPVLLFPAAFFWFMVPYWSSFPTALPQHLQKKGLAKPTPWPLASERLSWLIISIALAAWAFLFSQALPVIGKIGSIYTGD